MVVLSLCYALLPGQSRHYPQAEVLNVRLPVIPCHKASPENYTAPRASVITWVHHPLSSLYGRRRVASETPSLRSKLPLQNGTFSIAALHNYGQLRAAPGIAFWGLG